MKDNCVFSQSVRHVWSDELIPPTMGDARRAGAALAAEGAGLVLLFGSVATGDQRNGSDIDLAAVFDDLDRQQSRGLRHRLAQAARDAAGCEAEVEVFVTDRPEWAHRTDSVASSFEAHIAPSALVLFDRPALPGSVRWDKQISRPADDRAEALSRLEAACRHLGGVMAGMDLGEREMRLSGELGASLAQDWRRNCLWEVCRASSMAARTAMGAVVAAEGRYARRDLDIAGLADTLSPEHQAVAEAARALDPAEVDRWWGVCSSYECREVLPLQRQAEIARSLAGPAADLVAAAAGALEALGGDTSRAQWARRNRDYIQQRLRDRDIATGRTLSARP